MTASFFKIAQPLVKVQKQDEYNIYVSMLDEEELECLKYAQRLRTYNNRQLAAATPTDTDESKPESEKRGRNNKAVQGEVIDVDMASTEKQRIGDIAAFSYLIAFLFLVYAHIVAYGRRRYCISNLSVRM